MSHLVVSNHWTGLLDWNTGMDYWTGIFFWFYTFLRVGLLYIWVTCDNILVLSGEDDTLILKSSCDKPIKCISIHCATLLYGRYVYPKMFLSLLGTHDYCDTTFYNIMVCVRGVGCVNTQTRSHCITGYYWNEMSAICKLYYNNRSRKLQSHSTTAYSTYKFKK